MENIEFFRLLLYAMGFGIFSAIVWIALFEMPEW